MHVALEGIPNGREALRTDSAWGARMASLERGFSDWPVTKR